MARAGPRLRVAARGFSAGGDSGGSSSGKIFGGFALGALTASAGTYALVTQKVLPGVLPGSRDPAVQELPEVKLGAKAKVEPTTPAPVPEAKAAPAVQASALAKEEKPPEPVKPAEPTAEEIEEAKRKQELQQMLESQSAAIASMAQSSLKQVDQAHQSGHQRREEALVRLKHSLEVGDLTLMAEALAEAKAAHVPSARAEMQLAEGLCSGDQEVSVDDLLEISEDFRDAQEAKAKELERCQGKSRKELEERMVELTRMLANARLHSKARLEQALQSKLTQEELRSLKGLYASLKEAEKDFDQAAEVEFEELKQQLRRDQEEPRASVRSGTRRSVAPGT
ncbi:unnamed protein product [Durusdinium trenchii]|uniref:Uncharacterized protein n=1 Tax=Durusdinium trenchii TaxID=1381693 RepID=A0ABP0RYT1_9DINO